MVSRAFAITAALLIATLVTAIVGYSFYRSYYNIYNGLEKGQTLAKILNNVKSLSYVVIYSGQRTTINVNINKANGFGIIKVANENRTEIYKFYFDLKTGSVYRVEEAVNISGNTTGYVPFDVTKFVNYLDEGVIFYSTTGGGLNVTVGPGLVPLTLLYTIGKDLNISWKIGRGLYSRVGWDPLTYTFNGIKYKGVLVDIRLSPPSVTTTQWERATEIRAVAIKMNNLYVFPSVAVIIGINVIAFNLTSIEFSG